MKRTAVLVSAAALAALGSTLGLAHAEPALAPADAHVTSFSDHEQDAALKFWTATRLRAAKEVTPAPASANAGDTPSPTADDGPALTVPPLPAPASAEVDAPKRSRPPPSPPRPSPGAAGAD